MKQAETLIHGGSIYTMEPFAPTTNAVAVADGRILALGEEALDRSSSSTHKIDLDGRSLLPGLQDAHMHPLLGGLHRNRCDLSEVHSWQEYKEVIAKYAKLNASTPWIQGAGWYGDVFPTGFPTKELLDEVVPERPAILMSHDGHGAWVNSAALHAAGIDHTTPDPERGRIQRDADGEPTGMLIEHAASLVTRLLSKPTEQDIRAALLEAQRYLHSVGVTAWQDAAVGEVPSLGLPDAFEAYRGLAATGELTMKVIGALWWQHGADAEEQVANLSRRREMVKSALPPAGFFQTPFIKIMLDGVCENFTAATLEAYRGRGNERGELFLDSEELDYVVELLERENFNVHIHAVGDRAVKNSANSFGKHAKRSDHRHQITHIDLIDDSDIKRMSESKIIANIQPLWARRDPVLVETKLPYLTEAQQARHFIFRSLVDAQVPLACSSDWPVSSPNPFWGMHVAVNRTAPPEDPHAQDEHSQSEPLLAMQKIEVHDALRAYTSGAAFANRLDGMTGSISPGKCADLVAVNADPYNVNNEEIGNIKTDLTMVNGSVVYES